MDYFALASSAPPALKDLVVAANRTKKKPTSGYWMTGDQFGLIQSSGAAPIDARSQPLVIDRAADRYADLITLSYNSQTAVAPKTGYFSAGGVVFRDQLQITADDPLVAAKTVTKNGKVIKVLEYDERRIMMEDLGVPMHGFYIVSGLLYFIYHGYVLFVDTPSTNIGKFACQMTDGSIVWLGISTTDSGCIIPDGVEFIQLHPSPPLKVTKDGFAPGYDAKEQHMLSLPGSNEIYYKSLGPVISQGDYSNGPFYASDGSLFTNKLRTINGTNYYFNENGMRASYDGDFCQLIYSSGSIGVGLASNKTITSNSVYPTPQAIGTPFVSYGNKNLVVSSDGTTVPATSITVVDSSGKTRSTIADGDKSTMTVVNLEDGAYDGGTIQVKGMKVQQTPLAGPKPASYVAVLALILIVLVALSLAVYVVGKKVRLGPKTARRPAVIEPFSG